MLVLGINGGFRPGYQDTSAVLVKDGKAIYAVEEERFTRIKHSPGQIPEKSIQWILEQQNISTHDIDLVASHGITFGEEFESKLKKYFQYYFKQCPPIFRVHHHLSHAASAYYASGFNHYKKNLDKTKSQITKKVMKDMKKKVKRSQRMRRGNLQKMRSMSIVLGAVAMVKG